jgi:hypothetical protein
VKGSESREASGAAWKVDHGAATSPMTIAARRLAVRRRAAWDVEGEVLTERSRGGGSGGAVAIADDCL